jgi:hypothetical protein
MNANFTYFKCDGVWATVKFRDGNIAEIPKSRLDDYVLANSEKIKFDTIEKRRGL